MTNKEHILNEIRRTAQEGRALGMARFESETGIRRADWMGKIWARWSDAIKEAGLEANFLNGKRDDEEVLSSIFLLTKKIGKIPSANDIKLECKQNAGFPAHNTVDRLGNKVQIVHLIRKTAAANSDTRIVSICDSYLQTHTKTEPKSSDDDGLLPGVVYLFKFKQYFKIGRSNSSGRRAYEVQLQLPDQLEIIHSITTDDVIGIEAYWHKRFSKQRRNGEWFELTSQQINAFKRRKFM